MSRDSQSYRSATSSVLDAAEVEDVLSGAFYSTEPVTAEAPKAKTVTTRRKATKPKPTHYKVICISMYMDDIARLDGMVRELKARGLTKANRSALIRHALSLVDLDKVPRGL